MIYGKIKNKINQIVRKIYLDSKKIRLKNKSLSLISSNCNGGVVLSDLSLPFNSPFVNLWICPKDFIKLCNNLSYYMEQNLKFIEEENITYPVALLDDVKIYFQHYPSNKDAEDCWNRRKKRIDYTNLFFMLSERDNCSYDDLLSFDALPYENKVVFTHKTYSDIKSSVYIKGFEHQNEVGILSEYNSKVPYKRIVDQFNYVEWFNNSLRDN